MVSEFSKMRSSRIGDISTCWLQAEAMKKGFDFNFLKCPFRVNRMTAWFYSQVCSGTLHTRKVVSSLYSDQELDVRCPKCDVEDKWVLHCLFRCKTASIARRKLSVSVSRQLDKLGLKGNKPIDI